MLLNFQTDLQPETPRGGAGCFQSMSQMRNIDFSYQHQYSWKHLCYGAAKRWIFVLWFMPFIAVVSLWGRVSKSVTTLIPLTNEPNSNKDLVLWESLGWSLPLMGWYWPKQTLFPSHWQWPPLSRTVPLAHGKNARHWLEEHDKQGVDKLT